MKSREYYRHRKEKSLFVISIIVSVLIFIFLTYLGYAATFGDGQENVILLMLKLDSPFARMVMRIGGYVAIAIILLLVGSICLMYKNDMTKAEAYDVYVTKQQFAIFLKSEKEYAKKLGIKELPKLFISKSDTYVKVFGANIIKNFKIIRIPSEEIIATVNKNYYSVKFHIAKHLAYKYMGYYSPVLMGFTIFAKWLPILNKAINRVMEYGTDKVAAELVGKDIAIKSIINNSVNVYFLPYMNTKNYIDNVKNVIKNKNIKWPNTFSDVPLPAYRIDALKNNKDGKLF